MNTQNVLSFIRLHPWLTSYQVCEQLGMTTTRDVVRSEIKTLIDAGKVQKVGRGKGTRYASADATEFKEKDKPVFAKDEFYKLRKVLSKSAPNGGVTTKEIAMSLGMEVADTREFMKQALIHDQVVKSGNRRTTRWHPFGTDVVNKKQTVVVKKKKAPPRETKAFRKATSQRGSVKPQPTEPELDQAISGEPNLLYTIAEAVDKKIDEMKTGKQIEPVVLAKRISDQYKVSQSKAHERIIELIRTKKLFHTFTHGDHGRRVYCWVPSPGEGNQNAETNRAVTQ